MSSETVRVTVGSERLRVNAVVGNEKPRVFANQTNLIVRRLRDLSDVDMNTSADGSILVYDAALQKFIATTILSEQVIDGGTY